MVRKIFFYTVSVHHRPTSSSSSSSTLLFAPASSFALLCATRRHISPHHRLILHRFRPECRRPTFLPPATSITPVDARTSFILFETDDHWFAHNLRHSTSPSSFLHHRRSFSSSMCRTPYYHQHESTDLLDMYSDGARTLRITSFGETRSSKGREFKGHVLLGNIFE